jgi:hypothetical protein
VQRAIPFIAIAIGVAGSCSAPQLAPRSDHNERALPSSNVTREDYAGSVICGDCHRDIADKFARSPMHRMTRAASPATVRGRFDGRSITLGPATAIAESSGDDRFIRVKRTGGDDALYRVTKVIGGRVREDYAGVAVRDGKVMDHHEQILPMSYLLEKDAWRYKGYSVMLPERPDIVVGPRWSQTCIFCHNTAPAIVTLYDELSSEKIVYQGSPSSFLPDAKRIQFSPNESLLVPAIERELKLLGGEPKDSLQATLKFAARVTFREFNDKHLIELGIGCEACHNGARAHAADPTTRVTFELRHPGFERSASHGEIGDPALEETRTCVRCHTVLFSQYEPTWEGGTRTHRPGGSTINSGEARDFLLGACSSKLTCSRCHDPHGEEDPRTLDMLATPSRNATCTTGCHEQLAIEGALQKHAHHDPQGEGASCMACHMPKKNMGLDYDLTRYHRIGSPTDVARVENDRPLECALCHSDWSVKKTLSEIERLWGKRYDARAIARLYPNQEERVLDATLRMGQPHERAVAAATLGIRGASDDIPRIETLQQSEFPLLRAFALEAVERLRAKPQ